MIACPLGTGSRLISEVSMCSAHSAASSILPASSCPTLPAWQTFAPARAMAIDWFRPFPPHTSCVPKELIVSAGRTISSTR